MEFNSMLIFQYMAKIQILIYFIQIRSLYV